MAEVESLEELFRVPGKDDLPEDVAMELKEAMRLHSLTPPELFYKWESYCMKMGSENTTLNHDTAKAFRTDILETLEREARSKGQVKGPEKKTMHVSARAVAGDDMLGMMGVTTFTPRTANVSKRKGHFGTPTTEISKSQRSARKSSPTDGRTTDKKDGITVTPFVERTNAGEIVHTLNDHLNPFEPPIAPSSEARVKTVANTEIKKFGYKPLAMHLSEASEVLDERIDDFLLMVQDHYKLEDDAFGNAASKSTHDVVAVGRIASDTPDSKPNEESLVLETSRRTGAGLRIPLKFNQGVSGNFFPGQIVAFRGRNSSGEYFAVSEILEMPMLKAAASSVNTIDAINEKVGYEDAGDPPPTSALNIMVSAGPYTADDNLDFEPLHALCSKAQDNSADVLILIGPLLDIEHPLIASGDFELPEDSGVEPDQATLVDVFRYFIGNPINRLAQSVPSITVILVPSVREAVNKHVSWPQQNLSRKELGLAKQVKPVSNPVTISLNEIMIGISAADVLYDMRLEEVNVGRGKVDEVLNRLPRHIIQQRHFFPMYPPVDRSMLPKSGTEEGLSTGTSMDISYLKLAEFGVVRPDVLILPSALSPFAKVVEGVLVVNPGSLSKRRGPGQYSQMTIYPRQISNEERSRPDQLIDHRLYDRSRVDIVRI